MTDRELLELAAGAAGLKLVFNYDANLQGPCIIDSEGFPEQWNPLEDNGDALRLAGKLFFTVQVGRLDGIVVVTSNRDSRIYVAENMDVATNKDEAICRAIVFAAAEVGKSLTTGANHD